MIHIVVGKNSTETHTRACYLAKTGTCMDISRQGNNTHISVSDYYQNDTDFIKEVVTNIYEGKINAIPNSVAIHYI